MKIKSVPVKVAAAILGKAEQVIRCSLVLGKLPYGEVNVDKKYCTYYISAEKFKKYAGCSDADIARYADKLGCELNFDED